MFRLLSVELKKIQYYRAAWIFLGFYLILLPLCFNIFKGGTTQNVPFDVSTIYSYPEVWAYLSFVASFFHVLPGFLVIMLVSNEYTYRTFRQHIIDGYSKVELIGGKILLNVLLSVVLAFYILVIGLYFGLRNTSELTYTIFIQKLYLVPVFALQTFAYLTLAFLSAVVVRRAALAIVLYLLYIWLIEKLIRAKMPESVSQYFPANVFSDLISFPMKGLLMMSGVQVSELSLTIAILATVFYIALFSALSFLVIRKRDL